MIFFRHIDKASLSNLARSFFLAQQSADEAPPRICF